jgi:radical SAM superfamily enzyme YgiQ (UPF0313 family)
MKVILAAVNAKFIHSNLGVRYLKAFTGDIDYECSIFEFSINDKKERVLEALVSEKPDVLAFSCYIWNIEFIRYLALHFRLINSECIILYGGPEVSYDAEDFLRSNTGDFVIEGEGEETFREFILSMDMNLKKDSSNILERIRNSGLKGLFTKIGGEIYYAGPRELMDMEKIKFPYGDMKELENKIVYYEASRGCPFNCKYCLSSTSHGVRFLSMQRIKYELDFLIKRRVRLVKFVDRTFNCNKKFAMEIWGFLINSNTDTKFHFEISADILDEEEIQLLSRAPEGLFQFEVGVQTTNTEVLKNINRHVDFNDIKEKVCELEKINNIKQHLDLIAGLPGEDFASFKKSFNDVYSIRPEEIQLGFLKLLKGSKMRDEAGRWGMVYSPEPPYEVLKNSNISYEELTDLKRVEEVLDKYYNSNKFENILNYFMPKFESPFQFYFELGQFFHREGYFNRNISSADYYRIFIDFFESSFEDDTFVLKEIIKYDYLKHNKKKWLPLFLTREMHKEKERSIKNAIKAGEIKAPENCHIEKFFINMAMLLESGKVEKGEYYLLFDEDNNILQLN